MDKIFEDFKYVLRRGEEFQNRVANFLVFIDKINDGSAVEVPDLQCLLQMNGEIKTKEKDLAEIKNIYLEICFIPQTTKVMKSLDNKWALMKKNYVLKRKYTVKIISESTLMAFKMEKNKAKMKTPYENRQRLETIRGIRQKLVILIDMAKLESLKTLENQLRQEKRNADHFLIINTGVNVSQNNMKKTSVLGQIHMGQNQCWRL